jgi:hypothetical protein
VFVNVNIVIIIELLIELYNNLVAASQFIMQCSVQMEVKEMIIKVKKNRKRERLVLDY